MPSRPAVMRCAPVSPRPPAADGSADAGLLPFSPYPAALTQSWSRPTTVNHQIPTSKTFSNKFCYIDHIYRGNTKNLILFTNSLSLSVLNNTTLKTYKI